MSEARYCVNCNKYNPGWGGFGGYYPESCRHSTEVSPVTGKPLMFVKNQGVIGGPTMLEVRKELCKGDWFEERPIDVQAKVLCGNPFIPQSPEPDHQKPWWRFW